MSGVDRYNWKITWSRDGERKDDPDEIVEACAHKDSGDFIDFIVRKSPGLGAYIEDTVLRVRGRDVKTITRQELVFSG